MNSKLKYLLLLGGLLSAVVLAAQPPAPPATPIDGGLAFLLAGGAAYGIKKIKERRSK